MNPSASGWINKFGHILEKEPIKFMDSSLYLELKKIGFVYGIHLDVFPFVRTEHESTEDEVAKINLLVSLYLTFAIEKGTTDFRNFVDTVFFYYKSLEVGKISFTIKILSANHTKSQLEKLIDSRIYLGGNAFSRAFGNSLTNSLLFVDVLIFKIYLQDRMRIMEHASLLEYVTVNIAYHALNYKETNKADTKLLQLLASSLTYMNLKEVHFDGTYRDLLKWEFTMEEKNYFLDMACLTVWEDKSVDYTESNYVFGLGKDLDKTETEVRSALVFVMEFFERNKTRIGYLSDKNVAFQFYQSISKNVGKLILRNSKRLKKELAESRELVSLLTKSTARELTKEEKKKMQNQLLDIFKTIPSLAIFMLPGGAVLLPVFIKLIPKLLPSAFDDNRIE